MINVLWIDDRNMLQEDGSFFIALAKNKGIKVVNAVTVDEGMACLMNPGNHFDAIILDINCYLHNTHEAPDQSALSYAKGLLNENHIAIPYFVYSGLDTRGMEVVNLVIPEINPWDNRKIYHKGKDHDALFEAVRHAVAASENYQLRTRYENAFGVVAEGDLLRLLKDFETDAFGTDKHVLMRIRPLLEQIANFLEVKGLVSLEEARRIQNKRTRSNPSKDLSMFLDLEDKERKFVPTHIKRLFHLVAQCANEAMHHYGQKPDSADEDDDYMERIEEIHKIPNMVSEGKAPYLSKILVYGLLEILAWVKKLPIGNEEWEKAWRDHFRQLAEMRDSKPKKHNILSSKSD